MPARNTINSGVRYSKLASDDDGYIDLQVRGKKACNALKYANHLSLILIHICLFIYMSMYVCVCMYVCEFKYLSR